jgi:glycosyltransferase involved in cell wall biosynthesis
MAGYALSDLTLVMVARDAALTLPRALASLTPVLEGGGRAVLFDDGSQDDSRTCLETWADRWPGWQVRVLSGPADPSGVGAVRNRALGLVQTRLYGTLDADDRADAGYWPGLVAQFDRHPDLDFVRSGYTEWHGATARVVSAPHPLQDMPFAPQEGIMPVDRPTLVDHPQVWAGVYAMGFLDAHGIRYDPLRTAGDRALVWKLHLAGRSCLVSRAAGIHWHRDNPASLTRMGHPRLLDVLIACRNVLDLVGASGQHRFLPKAVRQTLALSCFHLERQDRLDPPTRIALQAGIVSLLAGIEPAVLAAVLDGIDAPRRARLAPVLPF